ncbi:hypothetical protein CK203_107044 [Vitis vinifera]|uniref:Uncharacterized protein n=1 Tax=Vitis vinifera TaxID=29760 RepID=A0A438EIZ0_VITVI|nr:hypothetical protein CK203_107044 [Vitis vinifera]
MEDCFEGNFKEPFKRVWNEGGRGYKLELHNNKAGRFLLCSAVCIKGKRFSLAFPKGKVSKGFGRPLPLVLGALGLSLSLGLWRKSKELIRCREEKGGGILLKHSSFVEGRRLQLDWWGPDVDCFREGACISEVWVSVLGLPMHLWGKYFFKRLGDACGGFCDGGYGDKGQASPEMD